jgi:hypothetical protein
MSIQALLNYFINRSNAAKDAVNVELKGSTIPDTSRVPMKRPGKVVTLANAVAIVDTGNHDYSLTINGGLTEDEILSYSNFKVSIYSTHNQTGTATIYGLLKALGVASSVSILYTEASNISATTGYLMAQEKAGGTGVGAAIKVVPALAGIHSNLIVRVAYGVAPASGALTIKVEMS